MRKIILVFVSLCLFFSVQAKTDTVPPVQMKYVKSLDKAFQLAKETNKPIFVNCYADWALPCRGMDKAVFNNKEFAEWMDKHFVNLWLDMLKSEEGKAFAKKYNVSFYAHYVVLNKDGEVVYRIVGGKKLPDFQNDVARALSDKTSLLGMNKAYLEGNKENDKEFLREYLITLDNADEKEKHKRLLKQYLSLLKEDDFYKKKNWRIISPRMNSVDSPMFVKLENHKEEFVKENSIDVVNKKLNDVYGAEFFTMSVIQNKYSKQKFDNVLNRLEKQNLDKNASAYLFYEIGKLKYEKKYTELISLLDERKDDLDYLYLQYLDCSLAEIPKLTKDDKKLIANYIKKKLELPINKKSKAYHRALQKLVQQEGIHFEKITFKQALAKAKKENKLIFLDAYTTWCGPCKMMANQVFVLKEVGDVFNKHFINLKIDMEKGEGRELARQFHIAAYPTFLLIDSDGEIVHKAVGGMGKEDFISTMLRGKDENRSYRGVKMKYPIAKFDKSFMVDYCLTLASAGESIHSTDDNFMRFSDSDATEVLSKLSIVERTQPSAWELFNRYLNQGLENPIIAEFVNNIPTYKKKVAPKEVELKLKKIFYSVFASQLGSPISSDEWKKLGLKVNKVDSRSIQMFYEIISAYREKDYSKIVEIYNLKVAKMEDKGEKVYFDRFLSYLLAKAPETDRKSALQYIQTSQQQLPKNYQTIYKQIKRQLEK